MIEIMREGRVESPIATVWELVSSADRAADWFSFADRVVVLSGEGAGQRRRHYGRWGRRRCEIDQEVITYDPPRTIAWRHLAERLDGKPAPRFAESAEFRIELDEDGTGTRVRLRSRQQPASAAKGLVMRLFGTKDVARTMEASLGRLATALSASPQTGP